MTTTDRALPKLPTWPLRVHLNPGSSMRLGVGSDSKIWLRAEHDGRVGWKHASTASSSGPRTVSGLLAAILEMADSAPLTLTAMTDGGQASITVEPSERPDADMCHEWLKERLDKVAAFLSIQPTQTLVVIVDDSGVVTDVSYFEDGAWLSTCSTAFIPGDGLVPPGFAGLPAQQS